MPCFLREDRVYACMLINEYWLIWIINLKIESQKTRLSYLGYKWKQEEGMTLCCLGMQMWWYLLWYQVIDITKERQRKPRSSKGEEKRREQQRFETLETRKENERNPTIRMARIDAVHVLKYDKDSINCRNSCTNPTCRGWGWKVDIDDE